MEKDYLSHSYDPETVPMLCDFVDAVVTENKRKMSSLLKEMKRCGLSDTDILHGLAHLDASFPHTDPYLNSEFDEAVAYVISHSREKEIRQLLPEETIIIPQSEDIRRRKKLRRDDTNSEAA